MFQAVRHGVVYFIGAAAAVVAAHCSSGCMPARSADVEYRDALIACVDNSKSAEESRECRRKVNEKYDVCTGVWPQYQPCQ